MSNGIILELPGLSPTTEWQGLIGPTVTELNFPEGTELNIYGSILSGANGTPEEIRRLVNTIIQARAKAGTLDDAATAALTAKISSTSTAAEAVASKEPPAKRRAGCDTKVPRQDW